MKTSEVASMRNTKHSSDQELGEGPQPLKVSLHTVLSFDAVEPGMFKPEETTNLATHPIQGFSLVIAPLCMLH